jgi:DNA-binding transcriptional LysR family regulator
MFKADDDLIKFIDKVSSKLTQSIKLQDPYIDQLMELKQLAWTVRNATGDAAVMSSYALEGRPQSTATIEDYLANVREVRSTWEVEAEIDAGLLVPLLDEFAAPPNGIYAVFPQRKHLPLRVRLWLDFLKAQYARPEFWGGTIAAPSTTKEPQR